jgi:hypothetical protein
MFHPPHHDKLVPVGRQSAATAWPHAQRADIPGSLSDGSVFNPGYFLDARTVVGTASSLDGASMRLIYLAGSKIRELRRLPTTHNPDFANFAASGDQLVWTEHTSNAHWQIWALDLHDGTAARRLTTGTGDADFYGSQYDLVIAQGRVYWTATAASDRQVTEIRSVALTGGPVEIRREPGVWALSAWPWLNNGGDQEATTRLLNMATNRVVTVHTPDAELATCSPTWCRVRVTNDRGLTRIDLMHPDGTARQRIAGSATAALPDVAELDRFEVLSESDPNSALTGAGRLLMYDIATKQTVDLSAQVRGAYSRGGILWWSTGDQNAVIWHSIDLHTL